jgi:hypothetical protein
MDVPMELGDEVSNVTTVVVLRFMDLLTEWGGEGPKVSDVTAGRGQLD